MRTIVYECPTCHVRVSVEKPEEAPYRPFCSERCKLVDLAHWLNEEYRISEVVPEYPDRESDDEPDERPPDAPPV